MIGPLPSAKLDEPMQTTSVLVVEDDPIIGADMRSTLERHGFKVTLAQDATTALGSIGSEKLDVALLDVGLGEGSGVEVGRALAADGTPFVYVTGQTDAGTLSMLGTTHPAGFVSKPFTDTQLVGAVRVALAGQTARDRYRTAVDRITATLLELGMVRAQSAVARMPDETELEGLSPREWEVLRGLLSHKRVPTIAAQMHISQSTVRNHLKSIYAKLDVHSQQELLERFVGDR